MGYSMDEFYGEEGSLAIAEFRKQMPNPTDYRPVVISKETYAAIDAVLEYCWTTEFDDFVSSANEEKNRHVFASLLLVSDWMEQQPPLWVKPRTVFLVFALVFGVLLLLPELLWLGRECLGWSGFLI